MPFAGVVVPEDLKLLSKILDDYCREHDVPAGVERDNVAHRIMGLYKSDVTSVEELTTALNEAVNATDMDAMR